MVVLIRLLTEAEINYLLKWYMKRKTSQFARIHRSSLIKIEKILNRPITMWWRKCDCSRVMAH